MTEPTLQLIQTLVERVPQGQRRTDEKLERLIDDTGDVKIRMTASEEAVAGINRRLDRIEQRLDRIERITVHSTTGLPAHLTPFLRD